MTFVATLLVAAFLAMGLNPTVSRLERTGLRRGGAVAIVFVGVLAFFAAFGDEAQRGIHQSRPCPQTRLATLVRLGPFHGTYSIRRLNTSQCRHLERA